MGDWLDRCRSWNDGCWCGPRRRTGGRTGGRSRSGCGSWISDVAHGTGISCVRAVALIGIDKVDAPTPIEAGLAKTIIDVGLAVSTTVSRGRTNAIAFIVVVIVIANDRVAVLACRTILAWIRQTVVDIRWRLGGCLGGRRAGIRRGRERIWCHRGRRCRWRRRWYRRWGH